VKLKIPKVPAMIPTASMADIAFLMIIYFMLTTSFSPVKMSVDLAEAANRAEVEKGSAIIAVAPNGTMEVSDGLQPGRRIETGEELDAFIKDVLAGEPTKQFIIKADRSIRYEVFNAIYERLRNNNTRRIALLTEGKQVTTQ
jgi:biopolymer transport protein ExbD